MASIALSCVQLVLTKLCTTIGTASEIFHNRTVRESPSHTLSDACCIPIHFEQDTLIQYPWNVASSTPICVAIITKTLAQDNSASSWAMRPQDAPPKSKRSRAASEQRSHEGLGTHTRTHTDTQRQKQKQKQRQRQKQTDRQTDTHTHTHKPSWRTMTKPTHQ